MNLIPRLVALTKDCFVQISEEDIKDIEAGVQAVDRIMDDADYIGEEMEPEDELLYMRKYMPELFAIEKMVNILKTRSAYFPIDTVNGKKVISICSMADAYCDEALNYQDCANEEEEAFFKLLLQNKDRAPYIMACFANEEFCKELCPDSVPTKMPIMLALSLDQEENAMNETRIL